MNKKSGKSAKKKGGLLKESPETPKKTAVKLKSTPGHLAYSRAYRREQARRKAAGESVDLKAMSLAGKNARAELA